MNTVAPISSFSQSSMAAANGGLVDDRPQDGVFQVHPEAYANKEVFELEMEFIFGRTWNFLGLESQLKGPHSFFTTDIGRTPILVTRDKSSKVGAFLNVCRHKGALLCRASEGTASIHSCPYHHWTYSSAGSNVGMKARSGGGYSDAFKSDNHDLIPLARLSIHNGLIFGSLSPDVPTLDEFLGDVRYLIDLVVDQGPHGMEFIPGRAPYSYQGNWKLQMDNGLDSYHITSTHVSLLNMQKKRASNDDPLTVRTRNWEKYEETNYHYFNFPYGHTVVLEDIVDPEKRPLFKTIEEVKERLGADRAQEMLRGVQLLIFPNLQIATSVTSIFRQFHPRAVDLTEMDVRCLGAIGESSEQRSQRLRQFEDFFSASGLASPDDSVVYEDCQVGFQAQGLPYLQGYARGEAAVGPGSNEEAKRIGLSPTESLTSPLEMCAEIVLRSPYREWNRLLQSGIEGGPAYE